LGAPASFNQAPRGRNVLLRWTVPGRHMRPRGERAAATRPYGPHTGIHLKWWRAIADCSTPVTDIGEMRPQDNFAIKLSRMLLWVNLVANTALSLPGSARSSRPG